VRQQAMHHKCMWCEALAAPRALPCTCTVVSGYAPMLLKFGGTSSILPTVLQTTRIYTDNNLS
jgi:hypothetical protein